jgi:hypothetical protein
MAEIRWEQYPLVTQDALARAWLQRQAYLQLDLLRESSTATDHRPRQSYHLSRLGGGRGRIEMSYRVFSLPSQRIWLLYVLTNRLSLTLSMPARFDLLRLRLLHPSYLFPLVEASRRRAAPNCLLFRVWCSWTQPERDIGGLHRLPNDCDELLT